MSIEFLPFDTTRCSLRDAGGVRHRVSGRRIAANRRNAQRSTGPRSAAGKKRSSRNALKHGLCAQYACLPTEDAPTFHIYLAELKEELQPRTATQQLLFDQIANLMWRLRRLPEAQADLFERELQHTGGRKSETLTPAQVLARRFSDEANNGFATLGRYERGMHNMLMRLLRQYDSLKKYRPTTPYPDDEPPVEREESKPAWTDEHQRAQEQAFAARRAALAHHAPPRNDREAAIDRAIGASGERKRTQSNPSQNRTGQSESAKCQVLGTPPPAKRTHQKRKRNRPRNPSRNPSQV